MYSFAACALGILKYNQKHLEIGMYMCEINLSWTVWQSWKQSPMKHEIKKLIKHLCSYHLGKPSRPQLNHNVTDGFKPILTTTQYTGIENPLCIAPHGFIKE